MSTVTLYTFAGGHQGEDHHEETDAFTTYDVTVAREHAKAGQLAIIANEYEWSDSELLEDHRPEQYEIRDWMNNLLFNGERFESFEDGWARIYETVPPDDNAYDDFYVVTTTSGKIERGRLT